MIGNVAGGGGATGEPTAPAGAVGALVLPGEPVVAVGALFVLGVPARGTLVALAPLPVAGMVAGVVELVVEPGVAGNGLVPPVGPADGELVPLAAIVVGAAGVGTLLALGVAANGGVPTVAGTVPAGGVVALGPGGIDVGFGIAVLVRDGLPPEVATGEVLVGSAGGVLVGPAGGVGVTLAAAGVGLRGTGVAVCETLAGTGVGVDAPGVGVDALRVVVAVVVAAGRVFVGEGAAVGVVSVGPGVEVGALVIVTVGVPVIATGVPVEKTVDVAAIVVVTVADAGRVATGETDGGLEGLAEAVVGVPIVGLTVVATLGCGMTTVGAGAEVFVAAGNAGALDVVATTLGVGVMSGAGVAFEGWEIFES